MSCSCPEEDTFNLMNKIQYILAVLGAAIILPSAGMAQRAAVSSPVVSSAISDPNVLLVDYFRNANTTPYPSGVVDVVNPGSTGANICVDIYVLTADEELNECCGCLITPDQLLEFSINTDLTANPGPNGETAHNGAIKIISSAPNATPTGKFGVCDPGAASPIPTLVAWETHANNLTGTLQSTENQFLYAPLSATEFASLTGRCAFYETNLSGHGLCNCPAAPTV